MTIESQNFVASTTDIEKLAGSILDADQASVSGRGAYLKALVATTQSELGQTPRQRNARAEQMNAEQIAAQLKVFEAIFVRFHDAVVRVAKNTLPDPDADMLRQRTGFSRSAGSTVRGFIRAGNDIKALAVGKITKASLAVPRTRRTMTVNAMKKRAERLVGELKSVARNLLAANKDIATETFKPVIAMLATMSGLTDVDVKDTNEAMEKGVPFATRTDVFVPIDLSSIRAARKAA